MVKLIWYIITDMLHKGSIFVILSVLMICLCMCLCTVLALPSVVEDRILSTLSLTDMVITTQTQPPSQGPPDIDGASTPDNGIQDEDINSGLVGTVAAEYISTNDGAMEEDSERQTFEREIKEAIKHLEKESDMSAEVARSLQSTGVSGVESELKTTDETGSAISETAPEAEAIAADQQTVIPRVAHTKITQPLEVSHCAANRGSDDDDDDGDGVTDQCDPQQ